MYAVPFELTPQAKKAIAAPMGDGLERYVKSIKSNLDSDQWGTPVLDVWVVVQDKTPDPWTKRGAPIFMRIWDEISRRAAAATPGILPHPHFRKASEKPAL